MLRELSFNCVIRDGRPTIIQRFLLLRAKPRVVGRWIIGNFKRKRSLLRGPREQDADRFEDCNAKFSQDRRRSLSRRRIDLRLSNHIRSHREPNGSMVVHPRN
jgi:hypothetical protein